MIFHLHQKVSDELREALEVAASEIDFRRNFELCVSVDSFITNACSADLKILILWEPTSVLPGNYKISKWRPFDIVIVFSPTKARVSPKQINVIMPFNIPRPEIIDPEKRELSISLINDHKFSSSSNSLYGFRRKILHEFERRRIPHRLYGTNWRMSKQLEVRKRFAALKKEVSAKNPPSFRETFSELFHDYSGYMGRVESKSDAFKQSKFSLVIENDRDIISEKVFDSVLSRTFTFYVGPNLDVLTINRPPVFQLPMKVKDAVEIIEERITQEDSNWLREIDDYCNNLDSLDFCNSFTIGKRLGSIIKNSQLSYTNNSNA